jgi:hypothetical protein
MMPQRTLIAALSCLVLWTACSESTPTAPSVPPNQRLTLAPGETAPIQGTGLTLNFLGVSGDSRCPGDALCIQGGDALVHIIVSGDRAAEYELHTGDASRASALREGWRITLVDLQPYPFSSRGPIQPDQYRATFHITQ